MAAKGAIKSDHIPKNKYLLLIAGLPPLTVLAVSGIEDEIERADLPDRTRATGGNRKATEFTFRIPMHHTVERAACEVWFKEGQDPVSPTYKKAGTLVGQSGTGTIAAAYSLIGAWLTKRALPEFAMENEGEMADIEYTCSVDDIIPG